MAQTWRTRLEAALKDADRSKREVSLAAGMAAGYVHSILVEGKDPTIDNMLKVCAALGVEPIWIIFGVPVSKDATDLLKLWKHAGPETRDGILSILRAHKAA